DTNKQLADRLLMSLEAGLEAGGEHGPVRSAALLVVQQEQFPLVDLRVDAPERPIGRSVRSARNICPGSTSSSCARSIPIVPGAAADLQNKEASHARHAASAVSLAPPIDDDARFGKHGTACCRAGHPAHISWHLARQPRSCAHVD